MEAPKQYCEYYATKIPPKLTKIPPKLTKIPPKLTKIPIKSKKIPIKLHLNLTWNNKLNKKKKYLI